MRPSGQRALMIVIASAAVLAAAAGWLWNDDMAGGDGRSADGAEGVSAASGVGGANGASGGDGVSGSNGPGGTAQSGATRSGRENNEGEVQNPMVTIEMDSGAKIVMELYPDVAPNTVNNFVSLVRQGFYDGVIFHRIVPGFVIQGGDPQGLGIGGDRKSTRLNSSHVRISYAVFCLKKKKNKACTGTLLVHAWTILTLRLFGSSPFVLSRASKTQYSLSMSPMVFRICGSSIRISPYT